MQRTCSDKRHAPGTARPSAPSAPFFVKPFGLAAISEPWWPWQQSWRPLCWRAGRPLDAPPLAAGRCHCSAAAHGAAACVCQPRRCAGHQGRRPAGRHSGRERAGVPPVQRRLCRLAPAPSASFQNSDDDKGFKTSPLVPAFTRRSVGCRQCGACTSPPNRLRHCPAARLPHTLQ